MLRAQYVGTLGEGCREEPETGTKRGTHAILLAARRLPRGQMSFGRRPAKNAGLRMTKKSGCAQCVSPAAETQ
jgi:hypothetical protein